MKGQSSQIQLYKDIKDVVSRLDRLEDEIKMVLEKMNENRDIKLEKGLKEIKEGRGKLYKSLEEWEADMGS
jgi:hypothetical protein